MTSQKKIVVTGGCGFIGSHIVAELLAKGFEVLIVDNFSSSDRSVIDSLKLLSGLEFRVSDIDVCDVKSLKKLFKEYQPNAIIHCAGLKSVLESFQRPVRYQKDNVSGTISVLEAMESIDCKNIVFSSSATVYGNANYLPLDELHETTPMSPYGNTKLICEKLLEMWPLTQPEARSISLRYFNPVGAHKSGLIGENINTASENIMPVLLRIAAGYADSLHIFGSDYETPDGTGLRDYLHVVDLARAHVSALEHFDTEWSGSKVFNVSRGIGISVLELLRAFEEVTNIEIPWTFKERRFGDIEASYASNAKILRELSWEPKSDIFDMCRDSWHAFLHQKTEG